MRFIFLVQNTYKGYVKANSNRNNHKTQTELVLKNNRMTYIPLIQTYLSHFKTVISLKLGERERKKQDAVLPLLSYRTERRCGI